MPLLTSSYSDDVLYFSNSTAQAVSPSGGSAPVTGRHSTIERPESVRRVIPPTITMRAMRAAMPCSQNRMARRCASMIAGSICNSVPLGSVTLEVWFLFSHERLIGPFIVLRLHADCLRLRFCLDGLVDAHAPFLMDASLGHGMREGRTICKHFGQGLRLGQDRLRFAEPVVETPPLGLAAIHGSPGIKELGR